LTTSSSRSASKIAITCSASPGAACWRPSTRFVGPRGCVASS
jgi:hypothetical protein